MVLATLFHVNGAPCACSATKQSTTMLAMAQHNARIVPGIAMLQLQLAPDKCSSLIEEGLTGGGVVAMWGWRQ